MTDRDPCPSSLRARSRVLATAARVSPRDLILAVIAVAVGLGVTHGVANHTSLCAGPGSCTFTGTTRGLRLSDAGSVLLGLAAASLLLRRVMARPVLAFIAALVTGDAIAGQVALALAPALAIALITVAVRGDRLATWATIAWAVLVWLPLTFGLGVSHFAGPIAWLIVIAFGAEMVRGRRGRRAAQQRSREEAALRRAEEERLRIARELHDVLAHNISLISVQSGVALHLLDAHPEQARPALEIINDASGEALRELRSVLGVLRRVDEQAPRRPTAGLARLSELVDHAAAAGVVAGTQTQGTPRPLPAAVDLAAYRIVQESLTNVTRHAAGARVTVMLTYGAQTLDIEVVDDGAAATVPAAPSAAPGAGSGNGIVGMRERAVALGGELHAGPRADGAGFRVHARLPYGEAR